MTNAIYLLGRSDATWQLIDKKSSENGWQIRAVDSITALPEPSPLTGPERQTSNRCVIWDATERPEALKEFRSLRRERFDSPPTVAIIGPSGLTPHDVSDAGVFSFVPASQQQTLLLAKTQQALQFDQRTRSIRQLAQRCSMAMKRLTPRQKQIVQRLMRGMVNKKIAFQLEVSVRTVEIERAAILNRFAVGNMVELAHQIGQLRGVAGIMHPGSFQDDADSFFA